MENDSKTPSTFQPWKEPLYSISITKRFMLISQSKSFQSPQIPESSINNDLWFVFTVFKHLFKENVSVERCSTFRSPYSQTFFCIYVYSSPNKDLFLFQFDFGFIYCNESSFLLFWLFYYFSESVVVNSNWFVTYFFEEK
jgi:hypothetical protein